MHWENMAKSEQNKRAALREIAMRYRWAIRRLPIASLRMRDLMALMHHRYGSNEPMPDTKRAIDLIFVAINHMVGMAGDPKVRVANWCAQWCPWLPTGDAVTMFKNAILSPRRWTADKLGSKLDLRECERVACKIKTIGAIDCTKEQRVERRRIANTAAKAAARAAKGSKPRAEYLAKSVTAAKPWVAAGVSRATWYRNKSSDNHTIAPMRQVRVQHIYSVYVVPGPVSLVPCNPAQNNGSAQKKESGFPIVEFSAWPALND
jgi:hypothetical protein